MASADNEPFEPDTESGRLPGDVDAETLRFAMETLPPVARSAIELAYLDGLTLREIAAALGEPDKTVRTAMRIGLQTLRASLDDDAAADIEEHA